MALPYKCIKREKIMVDGITETYYTPQVASRGRINFVTLRYDVAHSSGIPETYISQILTEVVSQLKVKLMEGYVVEIQDLGSIYLTLEGAKEQSPENVSDESIRDIHVHLKVNDAFKQQLKRINFEMQKSKDEL